MNCDVAISGWKNERRGERLRQRMGNAAVTDCVKSGPSKCACQCGNGRRQKYIDDESHGHCKATKRTHI